MVWSKTAPYPFFIWFFSNLVGEEGPRIQGVKGLFSKDFIAPLTFFRFLRWLYLLCPIHLSAHFFVQCAQFSVQTDAGINESVPAKIQLGFSQTRMIRQIAHDGTDLHEIQVRWLEKNRSDNTICWIFPLTNDYMLLYGIFHVIKRSVLFIVSILSPYTFWLKGLTSVQP